MQLDQLKAALVATPKGANIVAEWTRSAKVFKTCTDSITKSVRAIGRVGIEYDNQKAVVEKRDSGELPSENAGLPKGQEWEVYPYLIVCPSSGKRLLRLYNGTSPFIHASVQWHLNGQEVSFAAIEGSLLASEKAERKGDCFCVNVEDITRLNRESDLISVKQEKTEEELDPVPF